MSSDPFFDLSASLSEFCDAVERGRVEHGSGFLAGSTAAEECHEEPLADQWGQRPCRDANTSAMLLVVAVVDQLRALATLLPADVLFAPATVTRGAVEAVGQIVYTVEAPSPRERVRRHMNDRLADLHAVRKLAQDHAQEGPDAGSGGDPEQDPAVAVAEKTQRIGAILASGERHGFRARRRNDPIRPPFLDSKQPSLIELSEKAVSRATPTLGTTYYRLLSAIAHSRPHGIAQFFAALGPLSSTTSGDVAVETRSSPKDTALRLMAAPLAGASMVEQLFPHVGWDVEVVRTQVTHMLETWGRIANVPYPAESR